MTTRRELMICGVAGLALASSLEATTFGMKPSSAFLWGAATAAHQVEGNNVNSDSWLLETLPGTPFTDRSGDACDHYHLFEQDIALLAGLGLNSYRFGIEWARIEPDEGYFSPAMLAHYGRMLDACRRHGLSTMVTLHHFTSPRWFAAKGGFENPDAVRLFARYTSRVVEALGDRIDWLCTLNEANLSFPPNPKIRAVAARALGAASFSTFLFSDITKSKPIVRDCHAAAREAVRSVRPSLPVGWTLALDDVQDAAGSAGRAEALRKTMYGIWLEASRDDDFLGVQNYTRILIGERGPVRPPPDAMRSQVGQEVYPPSLGGAVRQAAATVKIPIIVTEHGIASNDDALRIRHMDGALASLGAAMADGVDVRGYFHWSLMDNFEWLFGYRPTFGLVAVDRSTQRRIVKPSARHLGRYARRHRVPMPA